jgi:uncharacterized membrane protein YjdF
MVKDTVLTANVSDHRYSFDSKLYMIMNTVLTVNVYGQRYTFNSKFIWLKIQF